MTMCTCGAQLLPHDPLPGICAPIKAVPAQPFSDDPAVIIDGEWGTPPIRNLEGFTRDVTPRVLPERTTQ